ncbi:MAG: ABC transporter ATP-binding protein, partial [Burkholderiales bacterium]
GSLIRKLNNALGATSVFVTHDIKASFKIADEVVIIAEGRVVVQGSPEELFDSKDPYVRQFVQGESDGLVPFHIPAADYREDIDLQNITDL